MLASILILLAGVGVFIAGMNMLGDGLEKSAGKGMKGLLGRISNNRLAGVGIGAAVTAIIQSSSATSVMVIGFVNAGIMTLTQATSIVMGASIGTTITGVIVSLKSLGISGWLSLLAFVGVMMSFLKSDKLKQIGGILCGFGLIFVGLDLMGSAFDNNVEIVNFFSNLFTTISFPLLLLLCGTVFTAIIQSSSAATGIFITMVGAGALTLENALFLVLGANIGTTVTGALAAIGASTNAKRTAFINFFFKAVGSTIFTVIVWAFGDWTVGMLQASLPNNPQMQLAWFHVIFNAANTLISLPFIKQYVKCSEWLFRDKPKAEETRQFKYVDDRLLKTPPIAMMQVKKEIEYMISLAKENIENSFEAIFTGSDKNGKAIYENESVIDFTNHGLSKYLIKLSPLVSAGEEKIIGSYFHVLNDVERIGDHAENFHEIGVQMESEGLRFSDVALKEIKAMKEKISHMFEIASEAFEGVDGSHLSQLTTLENEVDEMKRALSASHFDRLAEGSCQVELSAYFFSTIAGLERVADHLINVGYSVLNPTGSQSEARKEALV
ncbi:MAG: Na/Pi cotransporter family protein [Clostridia bacterium]|nr:Na/Pi cotransporter family protein [Clostridia bacterium]